ncbi:MAG: VWA domain-containing protein [Sedimenticola sp.]
MIPLAEFHFLRPGWFLALIPALLLLIALWRRHSEGGAWQGVCDAELLPHLLLDAGGKPRRLPLLLLAAGWLLAVTALSGPVWERQPQPLFQMAFSRVVLLDLSPSMEAQDLKPSRLERARFKLQDTLEQSREGRTALVVFAGEPHLVTPLTDDTETIAAMVPVLSVDIVPAVGDSLLPALRLAEELLVRGGNGEGEILLISDGVSDLAASLPLVSQLRDRGIHLSVLAIGTTEGAPIPGAYNRGKPQISRLDSSGLSSLAAAGGGLFSPVTADNQDLERLLTRGASRAMDQARRQQSGIERWLEQGPWLLLPLLLLAAIGFRRGWLGLFFISVMLPPPPAYAFEWDELWQRPDQQAERALVAGDAATAADLFQQPEWQGVARYQAGDYPGAAEALADQQGGAALYNRGNALARDGKLQQAMESYDAVLKLQPEDEDALFNKQLLETLLQQQQKQDQGDGEGGSQDKSGGAPQQDEPGKQGEGEQSENGEQGSPQEPSGGEQDKDNEATPENGKDSGKEEGQPQEVDEEKSRESEATASPDQQEGGAADDSPEDSAAAARRDVEPPTEGEKQKSAPQSGGVEADNQTPLREKDLALEQWLRQVPDDPAGLLRRKFMLEHLQRQRGEAQ